MIVVFWQMQYIIRILIFPFLFLGNIILWTLDLHIDRVIWLYTKVWIFNTISMSYIRCQQKDVECFAMHENVSIFLSLFLQECHREVLWSIETIWKILDRMLSHSFRVHSCYDNGDAQFFTMQRQYRQRLERNKKVMRMQTLTFQMSRTKLQQKLMQVRKKIYHGYTCVIIWRTNFVSVSLDQSYHDTNAQSNSCKKWYSGFVMRGEMQ